jgi:hypothetical protein
MRTTLTLDPDVAARIERLRKSRDIALKDVVNEALRRGLDEMAAARTKRRTAFRTGEHTAKLLVADAREAIALLDEEHDRKKFST